MLGLTQGVFGAGRSRVPRRRRTRRRRWPSARCIRFIGTSARHRGPARPGPTERPRVRSSPTARSTGSRWMTSTLWYYMIVATAGHDTTSFALMAGGMRGVDREPRAARARCATTRRSSRRGRRDHPLGHARAALHALPHGPTRPRRRRQLRRRTRCCSRTRRPTATRPCSRSRFRFDVGRPRRTSTSLRHRRPLLPRRAIRPPRDPHDARQAEPQLADDRARRQAPVPRVPVRVRRASTSRSFTRFGRFQRLWFWLRNWFLASQCHNQNPRARVLVVDWLPASQYHNQSLDGDTSLPPVSARRVCRIYSFSSSV